MQGKSASGAIRCAAMHPVEPLLAVGLNIWFQLGSAWQYNLPILVLCYSKCFPVFSDCTEHKLWTAICYRNMESSCVFDDDSWMHINLLHSMVFRTKWSTFNRCSWWDILWTVYVSWKAISEVLFSFDLLLYGSKSFSWKDHKEYIISTSSPHLKDNRQTLPWDTWVCMQCTTWWCFCKRKLLESVVFFFRAIDDCVVPFTDMQLMKAASNISFLDVYLYWTMYSLQVAEGPVIVEYDLLSGAQLASLVSRFPGSMSCKINVKSSEKISCEDCINTYWNFGFSPPSLTTTTVRLYQPMFIELGPDACINHFISMFLWFMFRCHVSRSAPLFLALSIFVHMYNKGSYMILLSLLSRLSWCSRSQLCQHESTGAQGLSLSSCSQGLRQSISP